MGPHRGRSGCCVGTLAGPPVHRQSEEPGQSPTWLTPQLCVGVHLQQSSQRLRGHLQPRTLGVRAGCSPGLRPGHLRHCPHRQAESGRFHAPHGWSRLRGRGRHPRHPLHLRRRLAPRSGLAGPALRVADRHESQPDWGTKTTASASRPVVPSQERKGTRAKAAGRLEALHAENRQKEAPSGYASSVISAERSNSRTSARRLTSDRAEGSSPRARSTSTSVTIPITVE